MLRKSILIYSNITCSQFSLSLFFLCLFSLSVSACLPGLNYTWRLLPLKLKDWLVELVITKKELPHSKQCYHTISGSLSPKRTRWACARLYLQKFQLKIEHIKGSKNIMADALSRAFTSPTSASSMPSSHSVGLDL